MSGRGPVIRVRTQAGRLELALPLTQDVCGTCPAQAELLVTADLDARDTVEVIPLCGDCLAESLAVGLGARAVRAGARITDLGADPPPADDPLDLERRLRP